MYRVESRQQKTDINGLIPPQQTCENVQEILVYNMFTRMSCR